MATEKYSDDGTVLTTYNDGTIKKTYRNGTVVIVLPNGTVIVNGYILPAHHPDPFALGASVDAAAPDIDATANLCQTGKSSPSCRSEFENSVRGVAVGCERMPSGCSQAFLSTVILDVQAAHDKTLLPSYVGTDSEYTGPPSNVDPYGDNEILTLYLQNADPQAPLARRDAQRALHDKGVETLPGYRQARGDPVVGGCLGGIFWTVPGVGAVGIVGAIAKGPAFARVFVTGSFGVWATAAVCVGGMAAAMHSYY
jgi:hypothetical protein